MALYQAMAARILASTVRIEVQLWQVMAEETGYDFQQAISHATLMNGRV